MAALVATIEKFLRQHLRKSAVLAVGVSGGADSVTLVHALHHLRHPLGFRLLVLHFNHKIRKAADADERFVAHLCARLGIDYLSASASDSLKNRKGSLEDNARAERFRFFVRAAKKRRASAVLLAHTKDDLAETVMMRLLRGTGLLGLRGILPSRLIDGVLFLRPMLELERADIEAYIRHNRLSFRTDRTNASKKFFRNKIRLELLPYLKNNFSPNLKSLLASLARASAVDYDYIQTQASAVLSKVVKGEAQDRMEVDYLKLQRYHLSLQRMIVRLCFERIRGDLNRLTFEHISDIELLMHDRPEGSIVDLPDRICVQKIKGILVFRKRKVS